ncbi:hypothetical protein SAVIM40S_00219 [Streptomyces avidinii]
MCSPSSTSRARRISRAASRCPSSLLRSASTPGPPSPARGSSPHRARAVRNRIRALLGAARRTGQVGGGHVPAEEPEVHRLRRHPQGVGAVLGDQHPRAVPCTVRYLERLAQPRDVRAQRPHGAGRRPVAPDVGHQRVDGRGPALPHQQQRQQGPLLARTQIQLLWTAPGPQWAEQGESRRCRPGGHVVPPCLVRSGEHPGSCAVSGRRARPHRAKPPEQQVSPMTGIRTREFGHRRVACGYRCAGTAAPSAPDARPRRPYPRRARRPAPPRRREVEAGRILAPPAFVTGGTPSRGLPGSSGPAPVRPASRPAAGAPSPRSRRARTGTCSPERSGSP